ncbi:elongator complex protein 5 [Physcomitrium patens]|uniref:Elongator complex protein 5 n=1 Tax=Physcomitrium patens TaxID=3218 RepID=A9TRE7_PHYPA|nr:elongator complex protein 5-like [Physcomitrium patens]PNR53950.1 hypothetical protein PHYPA_007625 [Physcomitrium patens]|eukprot:XP_024375976.1 elongator complex protein 5-like [Physcomitrella patens]
MTEAVARQLRDGVAVGEQAPAVMVRDTLDTRAGPAISDHFFSSLCSNIEAARAQAKGLVAVALRRTPESYTVTSPFRKGNFKPGHWLQVVDCYTDPLGWNKVADPGKEDNSSQTDLPTQITVCHDVTNLTSLLAYVLDSGQAAVDNRATERFVVLIDSVSVLLRYHTLPALTSFLSALRSCGQVSAVLWLVHADLHESRVVASIEYLSTTVIHVEPQLQLPSEAKILNLRRGRIRVRTKKRNGRVREQVEEFFIELVGVNFSPVTLVKDMNPPTVMKTTTPKVQFNLDLSEKEREDRSKVILPFEHQGDGREAHIYDGRPDPVDSQFRKLGLSRNPSKDNDSQNLGSSQGVVGEIHYLRDSDDERPDSDEDPDDDLDI